jgi:dipeptidase
MVRIKENASVFAKNSDRDPGEPQVIHYCNGDEGIGKPTHPEHRQTYDDFQYPLLLQAAKKYKSPLKALISRPSWMWGAEMGINECAVAIANEAVFSTSAVDKKGLLGMDILRLALHNGRTAREAVSIIQALITEYGQGGNASYKGHLYYHNSFMIHDGNNTFILETAGKRWALKQVESFASISNAYTIEKDYQECDEKTRKSQPNFSHRHASALHLLFTKANIRQAYTSSQVAKAGPFWLDMRNILISNKGTIGNPDHSMGSICLNAKGLVQSQTTASMIVEYASGTPLVWLTGSPLPAYFPYAPYTISKAAFASNPFTELSYSYAFAKNRTDLTKRIEKASAKTLEQLAGKSRDLEQEFETLIRVPYREGNAKLLEEACQTCREKLIEHEKQMETIVSKDSN